MSVAPDGHLIFRAPGGMSTETVETFARGHARWIRNHIERMRERKTFPELPPDELYELSERLAAILSRRLRYYAAVMGVTYGRVTIRNQKTRWGSCSSTGNLNFNIHLAQTDQELIDYVIVHELAHRKEMNHSPAFWKIVESVLPDYRERRERLSYYVLP
jgi:predicted metal-dependent hydrolase